MRRGYERKADEVSIDIGGISIAFEENITEKEVNSILGGYDLILPYELRFDTSTGTRFYVIAPEYILGKVKKKGSLQHCVGKPEGNSNLPATR